MKLKLEKLSQRDPRWINEKLGTSASTLGAEGCVVTCLAMIENYYGFDTDPARLNQLFKDKTVFVERKLVDFNRIERVNEFVKFKERIDCEKTPAPLSKVDLELNEGRPVIVKVDLNPNQEGSDHFIVIIGKTEDGHYLAFDPWYFGEDAIYFDARYGDPVKGIFGMRLINGPVPKVEEKPNISDLEGQVTAYKQHLEDIKEHLRPAGVMPGDDFPKIIGAIDELVGLKKEYDKHLEEDRARLEEPKPGNEKYLGQWKITNLIVRFLMEEKS